MKNKSYLMYIPHVFLALWMQIFHPDYFKGRIVSLVMIQLIMITIIPIILPMIEGQIDQGSYANFDSYANLNWVFI